MAIYGPDGNILFRQDELEHHHPWCNMDPRAEIRTCKQCKDFYIQFPFRRDEDNSAEFARKHFPGVIKR